MFFFELLQLALGNREALSAVPTGEEWREIYGESQRQAVSGVALYGLEKLTKEQMPRQELLLQWIGTSQMISQRNAVMDKRCVQLLDRLREAGVRGTILKGQGIAQLYGEELSALRQSGDIDVYVDCGLEDALAFAKEQGQTKVDWDYKHLHLKIWDDTEVEMHYRVEVLLNLRKNGRLQRWFKEHEKVLFSQDGYFNTNTGRTNFTNGFVLPSVEFNVFYILLHIYRHFLYEGVGLRQMVDYYMVLRKVQEHKSLEVQEYVDAVGEFGMVRFARGLMWVMQEVLGMPKEWMFWEADEKEGRYILEQVMAGGNFGHYNERLMHGKGKMGAVMAILKHNVHLLGHYPANTLWAPVWVVWHKCWKIVKGLVA